MMVEGKNSTLSPSFCIVFYLFYPFCERQGNNESVYFVTKKLRRSQDHQVHKLDPFSFVKIRHQSALMHEERQRPSQNGLPMYVSCKTNMSLPPPTKSEIGNRLEEPTPGGSVFVALELHMAVTCDSISPTLVDLYLEP